MLEWRKVAKEAMLLCQHGYVWCSFLSAYPGGNSVMIELIFSRDYQSISYKDWLLWCLYSHDCVYQLVYIIMIE